MTFGWQGFSLEHPDDWAPVQLTGHREEGYVRIASSSRLACQLRWKHATSGDNLADRLRTYLERLESDAKRSKSSFDADLDVDGPLINYRYHGAHHGRGTLFYSESSQRVFFLELVSSKNDSMLSQCRSIADSFRCGDRDRWALHGLDVVLPAGLKVECTVLEAGHSRLDLAAKGVSIRAERWGFGEQLVAKHGLSSWAREALALKKAQVEESKNRVRLSRTGLAPTEALVELQPSRNQLTCLVVRSRKKQWRPEWDWIV